MRCTNSLRRQHAWRRTLTVCEALDPTAADEDPDSAAKMLDEIEDILADGIARVTIGLKHAKR